MRATARYAQARVPNYCQSCILPDTRPGVKLDASGICQGCRNAETKPNIDWDARARTFEALYAGELVGRERVA